MQVEIHGVHLDVGDSLRRHIEDTLIGLKDKYFEHTDHATVFFTKYKHLFLVEVHMNVGRGILLKGTSEDAEPYPAFDGAVSRLTTRLKKYKSKLRDHNAKPNRAAVAELIAKDYTLHSDDDDALPANNEPLVIAEMETIIEDLTVSDAVMRLELGDLSAVLFRNKGNGEMNMVYRRDDGNIGWIDPSKAKAAGKFITKKEPVKTAAKPTAKSATKPAAKKPAAAKAKAKPAAKKTVKPVKSAKTSKTVPKTVKVAKAAKAVKAAKKATKAAKPKKVTKAAKPVKSAKAVAKTKKR